MLFARVKSHAMPEKEVQTKISRTPKITVPFLAAGAVTDAEFLLVEFN